MSEKTDWLDEVPAGENSHAPWSFSFAELKYGDEVEVSARLGGG